MIGLASSTYGVEVHTWFRWRNVRGRDYLEELVVDGSIIYKNGSSRSGMGVWTRWI